MTTDSTNIIDLIYDKTLPTQLNDFLIYLDSVEKSLKTIKGYKIDIRLMLRYLKFNKLKLTNIELKNVDISDIDNDFIKSITYKDLNSFMLFLKKKGNQENDRARKVSAIKKFFNFLVTKEKLMSMEDNPALELEKPAIAEKEPIYLSIEDSKKLLNAIKGDFNSKRDYCMVSLFLNCGLRISELRNINLENIKDGMIKFVGKGNTPRTAYLSDMDIEAVDRWLRERSRKEDKLVDEDSKQALFINKNNTRISTNGIGEVVTKWVKKAGLKDNITPHKLRHTCATSMYENEFDIRVIQEVLGHKSLKTTTIYTHVDDKRRRSVAKANMFANHS